MVNPPNRNRDAVAAGRTREALGWGVVAVLLLMGAAASLTRPAPALIPVAQLEARSAVDAKALAVAIPGKYADQHLSLQGVGTLPAALSDIAKQNGVSAVRLWSPSGVLLASSDPADAAAAAAAEIAAIGAAHGSNAQPSNLAGQPGLLRIFEPVLPDKSNAVVAELVRNTSESGLPFKGIGAGLAVFGVLGLILALVSLLRAGGSTANVPAVAGTASVPAPAVPAPAAEATDDAGDPVADRDADRLAQKLKTSEASRAAMETQMEQLRAQLRVGTQGSEQIVADLDNSLASSQLRVHEAGEKLALAESRAREGEQRAAIAEEALSRATPSDAADRLVALESELATARNTISVLEGAVAEHQARTRDAEARAGEAEKRSTAVNDQVAQHAARADEVETRQRELEDRAASAEVRTTQAEGALAEAVQHAADLEARVTNAEASAAAAAAVAPTAQGAPDTSDLEAREAAARESAAQLQLELARAQDLAEQAVAKLEASEGRVASAEASTAQAQAKLADAESRARDAEARAAVAGAPARRSAPKTAPPPRRSPDSFPEDLSLADSLAPITTPVAGSPLRSPDMPPIVAEPSVPTDAEPLAVSEGDAQSMAPADDGSSATDPRAWRALAKSLRRDALGDEAADEADEEEVPEVPTAAMTEDDRSELRARLARASAKKRRKLE